MTTTSNKKKPKPIATGGIFQNVSGGNGTVIFQKNGVVRAYPLKRTKAGGTK